MQSSLAMIKQHTKVLIKDLGVDRACALTGRSAATLRRYASSSTANAGYLLSITDLLLLERAASYPYVTASLAEANGHVLNAKTRDGETSENINSDVMRLASRFGNLMAEYYSSIEDGEISADEAQRLLGDTLSLQTILVEMKQNLENEAKP